MTETTREGEWSVGGLRGRLGTTRAPTPDEVPAGRPFPTARGVLTKEEIEALLRPDLSDMDAGGDSRVSAVPAADTRPFALAGLDAPDMVAPAQDVPGSDPLVLSLRLTGLLRASGLCDLVILAEMGPEPAGAGRSKGIVHAVFETADHDPVGVLAMDARLAGALIEQLCGSHGPATVTGALSPLSRRFLMEALAPLAGAVGREAGREVVLTRIETEARLARLAPLPGTQGLEWSFAGQTGDGARGGVTLQVYARMADRPAPAQQRGEAAPTPPGLPAGLHTELRVRLVRLQLTTAQLARWAPGQTVLLGVPADQPVSLFAATRPGEESGPALAEGQVGRLGKAMAVRITRLNGPLRRPG